MKNSIRLLVALVVCCLAIAVSKHDQLLNMELSKEEISKFSLKNMKRILKDKGIECKECEDHESYTNKVFESQKLPVLKKSTNTKAKKTPQDKANIAKVLHALHASI